MIFFGGSHTQVLEVRTVCRLCFLSIAADLSLGIKLFPGFLTNWSSETLQQKKRLTLCGPRGEIEIPELFNIILIKHEFKCAGLLKY